MHDFYKLTKTEQDELAERLAGGQIVESQTEAHRDIFNIMLSTGTWVVGSYGWDDDDPTEWNILVDPKT